MDFTIYFIKVFLLSTWLAAPLLAFLGLLIVTLGLWVGKQEGWEKTESLYWAFVTATTVGYGDIRPQRSTTRLLSIIIAFTGLVLSGLIVAMAVNAATLAFKHYTNEHQILEMLKLIG
ncbi:potassium channel family protein [Desulfogranum japonicum]|uniref:potassium channel family protein n=1 Tax=Desulfogranum japonicum TaxID=231447 RepID=UPI0003F5DC14|nr:potassium channel family protein [Desulfogranum japonicum]